MKRLLLPALVVVATVIALFPVLGNGFTTWDDPQYIVENPLIRELSPASVIRIFTTPEFAGNYHPLTLLLHAVEYSFFGPEPSGYHLVSLLLHLVITLLVYRFILSLSGSGPTAFVVALLFGIHPVHVEPVAWAADQKDLLYSVFYLGSLLAYLSYRDSGRRGILWYGVLPLFLGSLLSKGLAVTLPVVLLLIDGHQGRKLDAGSVREKAPLFLLSLAFGIAAVLAQTAAGAVAAPGVDTPADRILTAGTGFVLAIARLLVPAGLSPYYPYPAETSAPDWIFAAIAAAIVAAGLLSRRRAPALSFGVAFFTVTILPVLQFLPVGNAMTADRYAYLPSIGLLYVVATAVAGWLVKRDRTGAGGAARDPGPGRRRLPAGRIIAVAALSAYAIVLIAGSRSMSAVWKDGTSLWERVIAQYPGHPKGYFNRGFALHAAGRFADAVRDYDTVLAIDPRYPYAHFNRGVSRSALGLKDAALSDYDTELGSIRDDPEIYLMRGRLLASLSRNDAALADFNTALRLDPGLTGALVQRGLLYTSAGDLRSALPDFDSAILLRPGDPDLHFNRANILAGMGRYAEAVTGYSAVLRLSLDDADAWYRRGMARRLAGDPSGACGDFARASELRSPEAARALAEFCR